MSKIGDKIKTGVRWGAGAAVGDKISSRFFIRNRVTLIAAVLVLMFFIAFKYECMIRMETIQKLESELSVVKTESIRERSTYMSRTREVAMRQLIDSLNINLQIQTKPPYTLSYEK